MRWKMVLSMLVICLTLGLGGHSDQVAAASKYKLKVNIQKNTVTVYKWNEDTYKPYKVFLCSAGKSTPVGKFRIYEKRRWHALVESTWGQYSARFKGSYLFHSVPYDRADPATLFNEEFNKLGKTASHGCIRLTVQDAKWIYDNCGMGTEVIVYRSKNPGPLGKPSAIKVQKKGLGYDPTDRWSRKNPYNKKKPQITGAKNKTIPYGDDTYDVKQGIRAKGTTGYKIAVNQVKTTIRYQSKANGSYKKVKNVDTRKSGIYEITYQITDSIGRKAKVTVKHTVCERKQQTPQQTPSPTPIPTPDTGVTSTALPAVSASPDQTTVPDAAPSETPVGMSESSK